MDRLLNIYLREINQQPDTKIKHNIQNNLTSSKHVLNEIHKLLECLLESRNGKLPQEAHSRSIKISGLRMYLTEAVQQVENLRQTYRQETLRMSEFIAKIEKFYATSNLPELKENEDTFSCVFSEIAQSSTRNTNHSESVEDARIRSLADEKDLLNNQLRLVAEKNFLVENQFRSAVCLRKQAQYSYIVHVRYDQDIGSLNAVMNDVVACRDSIKKERVDLQSRLAEQRICYQRYKEEYETAKKTKFLNELQNFRRARAVKIIQRTWRMYRDQLSSKKKRSKK